MGREVLISPFSIGDLDENEKRLPVSITKSQVRNSPSIDREKPVSRQHEVSFSTYYGYPYYWGGAGFWGGARYPHAMLADSNGQRATSDIALESRRRIDVHKYLRSCEAVRGYRIHATDGDIGHVEGFLADERTWAIRYLIVNTSNWWIGHQVLITSAWLEEVNWVYSKVATSLTRQQIKNAPAYEALRVPNRGEEDGIYSHYQREGYWHDKSGREAA